jgi:hypothetical protein
MEERGIGGPSFAVMPTSVANSVRADWSAPEGFKEEAQNVWAQNIVNASAPLITMINQRQARGHQVGARAFIRQILSPFG